MRSFFDKPALADLEQRIRKLDENTRPQWGKMNIAQMLAHCTATMEVAMGEFHLKRNFFSLFGWMFKGMIVSERPFGKNSPTAPEYRMEDDREYDIEITRFHETFTRLAQGPQTVRCFQHPFFGKMTCDDWGHLIYKHLDHHLTQFGV